MKVSINILNFFRIVTNKYTLKQVRIKIVEYTLKTVRVKNDINTVNHLKIIKNEHALFKISNMLD